MHLCIALPLNLSCIPSVSRSTQRPDGAAPNMLQPAPDTSSAPQRMRRHERRAFLLLALFAAFTSFVTSAMAAHLPGLLLAAGASAVTALTASTLLGPAQVAARVLEFMAARRYRFHPLLSARIATALHPIGGLAVEYSVACLW